MIGELRTQRLTLRPLDPEMASEMVEVLADPVLYRHTGGAPPTFMELTRRYEGQVVGWSSDRSERWLNWVVRQTDANVAVGYVQATVSGSGGGAELAWVIGTHHQRRGFATEAATAVAAWLTQHGVSSITASIHPANRGSQAVARRLGLRPTSKRVDGETVWALERAGMPPTIAPR